MMDYNVKLGLAQLLAENCNGTLVSTPRQLENETFVFEFPSKPGNQYAIYKSGYVRSIMYNRGYNGNCTFYTPLITKSVYTEWGTRSREVVKVNFATAIDYLLKRFQITA